MINPVTKLKTKPQKPKKPPAKNTPKVIYTTTLPAAFHLPTLHLFGTRPKPTPISICRSPRGQTAAPSPLLHISGIPRQTTLCHPDQRLESSCFTSHQSSWNQACAASIHPQPLICICGSSLQKPDSIYISAPSQVSVTKYSDLQHSFTKKQLLHEITVILYSLLQLFWETVYVDGDVEVIILGEYLAVLV